MVTIIDCQQILQEIREDLSKTANFYGTPYSILSAINILDCHYNICLDGGIRIELNFMNVHTPAIDIPKKYICDRDFVKHQIAGMVCRYLDIIGMSIEHLKDYIFDYQNRLVKDWEIKNKGE